MAPTPKSSVKKVTKKPNKHLQRIRRECNFSAKAIIHGARVAMDYRGYELENTHLNLPTMEQVRPQLIRVPITRITLEELKATPRAMESLGFKHPASIRKDKRDQLWASMPKRAKGLSRLV